jgi:hypothetical protein
MLCITALEANANAILNASGPLVLLWPMSMFIYAWLSADVDSDVSRDAGFNRLIAHN